MKIIIAPDSFKESLSANEVAKAIERGFVRRLPHAEYLCLPMADGGEGTTEALVQATHGRLLTERVQDPLGRCITAQWGLLGDGETAVVETAAASGLALLEPSERNPLITSSSGTGQLIKAVLDNGAKRLILGLGGSATNDCGAGLLKALGADFFDAQGDSIDPVTGALTDITRIDLTALDPRLQALDIQVACDVDNPLAGPEGASAVFGPQKGANAEMVQQLDQALQHFGCLLEQACGHELSTQSGSGAAGGIGAALLALTHVQLRSGIEIVMDAVSLDDYLFGADLVITGEGRMDSQSVRGKTPVGVAQRAKRYGCQVVALAGALSEDVSIVHQHGIDAVFSVVPGAVSLPQALAQAEQNIENCAQNVAAAIAMQLSERTKA